MTAGPASYFSLAVKAFGVSEFIVPKYHYRLGKMDKRSLDSLNLRRLRSSKLLEDWVLPFLLEKKGLLLRWAKSRDPNRESLAI